MRQPMQYGFPPAVLQPGEERTIKAEVRAPFRAMQLSLVGLMDEVRGSFRIRRSRLPLLDRNCVIAYSNVTRTKSKRRTTIEHRSGPKDSFVRTYLPESVVYVHTDPLSYVQVRQIAVGEARTLPPFPDGVPAGAFGQDVLGNGIPFPTTDRSISLTLRSKDCDIPVTVHAVMFGMELTP